MQPLRCSVAILAALSGLAAGHGKGRRAQAWDDASGFIWGTCGDNPTDDGGVTSCRLADGASCRDRLSDGPPDADIEVVLGNLLASTSEDFLGEGGRITITRGRTQAVLHIGRL